MGCGAQVEQVRQAAVSLVERGGRVLVVWNRRYGGWTLPGGMVEDGEPVEMAQARELREETGLRTASATRVYEGPTRARPDVARAGHVVLFRVDALGVAVAVEPGTAVAWFTRDDFLRWTPFADFYRAAFAAVPPP